MRFPLPYMYMLCWLCVTVIKFRRYILSTVNVNRSAGGLGIVVTALLIVYEEILFESTVLRM